MSAALSRNRTCMILLVLMDVEGKEPEINKIFACWPFPAPWCPSSVPVSACGVCVFVSYAVGHLSEHETPNCILGHVGYNTVIMKVSLLCYSYYPFLPFSATVAASPASYCMH